MAFYRQKKALRADGLVTCFERYRQATALRIARELGVLREYIRGDRDVIRDIAASWELYEVLFPEPEAPVT